MTDRQAGVTLINSSREDDVTTTVLRLEEGDWPSEPITPATVWRDDSEWVRVVDLHGLVNVNGAEATFESYGLGDRVPSPGGLYGFISWWTPDQLEVALDRSLDWQLQEYHESDHHHCLLTWAKMLPGEEAYRSRDGWVTPEAYEQYIRHDVLRLRSR